MKWASYHPAILSLVVLLGTGCAANPSPSSPSSSPSPTHTAVCVPAAKPEFSYVLTGFAVSMFTVDSCTGQFIPATPASIATGYAYPQNYAEEMVADPLGRFAYVANLVSNASDLATISMFTINQTSGVLTPTTPATVHRGFFPQEIAIDPLGRFVYTANSDDNSVSMFTINQTTGVLTPTTPASVSTAVPGELLNDPNFLTVDPSGKFLYVTELVTNDAAILMYSIDQTTGLLTPLAPATTLTYGDPWQLVVSPNGKFVYVVNNNSGGAYTDGVGEYTLNAVTGVLTTNSTVPNTLAYVAAGNGPTAIVVDPTSRFAYVVNRIDNTVSMYTIDPETGNLTLNATATYPYGVVLAGGDPFRIAFDPSGKFVYVTNENSGVSIFTVNTDGTLAPAGTTGVATGGYATALTTQ